MYTLVVSVISLIDPTTIGSALVNAATLELRLSTVADNALTPLDTSDISDSKSLLNSVSS